MIRQAITILLFATNVLGATHIAFAQPGTPPVRQPLPTAGAPAAIGDSTASSPQVLPDAAVADRFKMDEAVKTLTVSIRASSAGADLNEPISLDLGLGFPLLLWPVGRQPNETAPFGAVPQTTTAAAKIPAGQSASFSFHLLDDEESGGDDFEASRQLLAGVRVGDIRRIGFASCRKTPWRLDSYSLSINGKQFASRTSEPLAAEQQQLRAERTDLETKLATLREQYARLETLVASDTATAADLKRMEETAAEGAALLKDLDQLRAGWMADPWSASETLEADSLALERVVLQLGSPLGKSAPQAAPSGGAADPEAPPPDAGAAPAEASANTTEGEPPRDGTPSDALAGQDPTKDVHEATGQSESLSEQSLSQQKVLLEGRIQGKYPWFVDAQFQPFWQTTQPVAEALIKRVEVVLETASHNGAGTQNYVYFRTGAHKYPLNDVCLPLSAEYGPQRFAIDLLAGPLTASDLRGWAVGMLAVPTPFGSAPDRWHPQRIQVFVDAKPVYDSEENTIVRLSLAAVRLIPPKHLDQEGRLIGNVPNPRETYLWEAGTGQGLDLVHGGALDLPPRDDPNSPDAEPGLSDPALPPGDPSGDLGEAPDFPQFPGEQEPGPGDLGLGPGDTDSGSGDMGFGPGDSGPLPPPPWPVENLALCQFTFLPVFVAPRREL